MHIQSFYTMVGLKPEEARRVNVRGIVEEFIFSFKQSGEQRLVS